MASRRVRIKGIAKIPQRRQPANAEERKHVEEAPKIDQEHNESNLTFAFEIAHADPPTAGAEVSPLTEGTSDSLVADKGDPPVQVLPESTNTTVVTAPKPSVPVIRRKFWKPTLSAGRYKERGQDNDNGNNNKIVILSEIITSPENITEPVSVPEGDQKSPVKSSSVELYDQDDAPVQVLPESNENTSDSLVADQGEAPIQVPSESTENTAAETAPKLPELVIRRKCWKPTLSVRARKKRGQDNDNGNSNEIVILSDSITSSENITEPVSVPDVNQKSPVKSSSVELHDHDDAPVQVLPESTENTSDSLVANQGDAPVQVPSESTENTAAGTAPKLPEFVIRRKFWKPSLSVRARKKRGQDNDNGNSNEIVILSDSITSSENITEPVSVPEVDQKSPVKSSSVELHDHDDASVQVLPESTENTSDSLVANQGDAPVQVPSESTESTAAGTAPKLPEFVIRRKFWKPSLSVRARKKRGQDNDNGNHNEIVILSDIITSSENITEPVSVPEVDQKSPVKSSSVELYDQDDAPVQVLPQENENTSDSLVANQGDAPVQVPSESTENTAAGTAPKSPELVIRRKFWKPSLSVRARKKREQDNDNGNNNKIVILSDIITSPENFTEPVSVPEVGQKSPVKNSSVELDSSIARTGQTDVGDLDSPIEKDEKKVFPNNVLNHQSDNEYPIPPASPTKLNRARIKAIPRLNQRHASCSASESEADESKSHRRRNDSVCSATSALQDNGSYSDCPSPQKREYNAVIQRKCRRTEQSRKLAEARRDFQLKFKNSTPDRRKLTMIDYIFYNPTTNLMTQQKKEKTEDEEEKNDDPPDVEAPVDEPPKSGSDEENEVPAPQIKIGPHGEIIVDERSLFIENKAIKKGQEALQNSKVIDGDLRTSYGVYKRAKRSKDWSKQETLKFYKALNTIGTDFSLMCEFFPQRNRRELKMKFKKEERINRTLVDRAVMEPRGYDFSEFKHAIEMEEKELQEVAKANEREKQFRKDLRLKKEQQIRKDEEKKELARKRKESSRDEDAPLNPKPPKRPKRKKSALDIMNVLEETDADESEIESEDDYVFQNIQKPTRSGRVPKLLTKYEAPVPVVNRRIQQQTKPRKANMEPGSLMVVTTTGEKGEPVCKVFMVTEQNQMTGNNTDCNGDNLVNGNFQSIFTLTTKVIDSNSDVGNEPVNLTKDKISVSDDDGVTIPDFGGVTIPADGGTTIPAEALAIPDLGGFTIPVNGGITIPAGGEVIVPAEGGNKIASDRGITGPADNDTTMAVDGATAPVDNHLTNCTDGGATIPADNAGIATMSHCESLLSIEDEAKVDENLALSS